VHAYVPMSFAPGEAYQFDWSHERSRSKACADGQGCAHMKLSHSRMPFVRVYFRETQELVFDAHDKAFLFYGGVCRRGIYDNMKTAVEAISSARRVDIMQLSADVLASPDRACGLHARLRMEKGRSRTGRNLRDQIVRPSLG